MIEIPLTQGQLALIDDEDFELVSQYKWRANFNSKLKSFYALTDIRNNGERITILMHRLITDAPKGKVVDHINHNTLDNRKLNLRVCSQSENMMNSRKHIVNTSGYKGVSWYKQTKKWTAQIRIKGKNTGLGYFESPEKAYEAYCNAARIHHGEFLYLEQQVKIEEVQL